MDIVKSNNREDEWVTMEYIGVIEQLIGVYVAGWNITM